MRFDASPRPRKGVCHLQGLARTSVIVDAQQFGHIWFRSVIQVRRTGELTDRATGKHLPSSPLHGQRTATVRKILGQRLYCKRRNCLFSTQFMADLPRSRVADCHTCFYFTGVDFLDRFSLGLDEAPSSDTGVYLRTALYVPFIRRWSFLFQLMPSSMFLGDSSAAEGSLTRFTAIMARIS